MHDPNLKNQSRWITRNKWMCTIETGSELNEFTKETISWLTQSDGCCKQTKSSTEIKNQSRKDDSYINPKATKSNCLLLNWNLMLETDGDWRTALLLETLAENVLFLKSFLEFHLTYLYLPRFKDNRGARTKKKKIKNMYFTNKLNFFFSFWKS